MSNAHTRIIQCRRNACEPCSRKTRGVAAIVMVILMMVLNLIVVGVVVSGARDQDLTVRRLETVQSFYAAESGINMAMREVMLDDDEDGDGQIGSISDDGNDANDPVLGAARIMVTATDADGDTRIESMGRSGLSQRKAECMVEQSTGGTALGLSARYFTCGSAPSVIADVDWDGASTATAVVSDVNLAQASGAGWPGGPTNNWGKEFTGSITIPTTGTWTFYTRSDDGSKLWINGTLVVNNDGLHSMQTRSGTIELNAGVHEIEVRMFNRTGGFGLIVYWSGPGVATQTVIPATAFTH